MRIKYMRVSAQWFVDLCKGDETRRCRPIAHALPSDARVVDSKVSDAGWLFVVIHSESFPDVASTDIVPEHPPTEFEVVQYGPAPVHQFPH